MGVDGVEEEAGVGVVDEKLLSGSGDGIEDRSGTGVGGIEVDDFLARGGQECENDY